MGQAKETGGLLFTFSFAHLHFVNKIQYEIIYLMIFLNRHFII